MQDMAPTNLCSSSMIRYRQRLTQIRTRPAIMTPSCCLNLPKSAAVSAYPLPSAFARPGQFHPSSLARWFQSFSIAMLRYLRVRSLYFFELVERLYSGPSMSFGKPYLHSRPRPTVPRIATRLHALRAGKASATWPCCWSVQGKLSHRASCGQEWQLCSPVLLSDPALACTHTRREPLSQVNSRCP